MDKGEQQDQFGQDNQEATGEPNGTSKESGDESDTGAEVDDEEIRHHHSYEQVMLDVNRCAGRLEHIRQVYLHRTDDDLPPEDLTEEFELQRLEDEEQKIGLHDDNDSTVTKTECQHSKSEELDNSDKRPLRQLIETITNEDRNSQRELKKKLAKLIVKLLIKKPDLHYYQGFHDVCLTYMTILGDQDAYIKLDKLIDTHFSTFMRQTMSETQDFLSLLPVIIGLREKKLQEFLDKSEVGVIFALSWVITWFSHVIPNQRDVETIFKFLQDQHPHMILYLSAEIVLYKRERILELEPEMSTVHHFLCQVPRKENLPIGDLLKAAKANFERWSPEVVKQKLNETLKARLQLQNTGILSILTSRIVPSLQGLILHGSTRTAMMVLVLVSATALQFYRSTRE